MTARRSEHRRGGAALIFLLLTTVILLALPVAAHAISNPEVTTYAGSAGVLGTANGYRTDARFLNPSGVAIDSLGNLYVADIGNQTIRKITWAGTVMTLAGSAGVIGSADGMGSLARFQYPTAVTVDKNGNVYVADNGNHTIRKVTPAGVTTTLAGLAGSSGSADGLGSAARFNFPAAVAVDGSGYVWVADGANHTIRRVGPDGLTETIAGLAGAPGSNDGTGGTARFNGPTAIAVDGESTDVTVYVADTGNHTIRVITYDSGASAWVVGTIAGLAGESGSVDGGPSARFNQPQGIALDGPATIYVSDTWNHTIRKIARTKPFGVYYYSTSTHAGSAGSFGTADGPAATARFSYPRGVAAHPAGTVYVADRVNNTIRRIAEPASFTTFVGADRYATAILVSQQAYPAGAKYAFVVKGDNFPDALAAAPLAHAYGGPVILTPSSGLTTTIKAELTRLDPDKVFLIGLPDSLKTGILQAVPGVPIEVIRGADRYDTAARLAEALRTKNGSVQRIVLAAGDNFPDALSVAPLAAVKGWAILLTPQKGPLPTITAQKIQQLGVTQALVVGTQVNPPAQVTSVVRKVGFDRYYTSALVASYASSQGLSFAHIAVAKGDNYPDALVVGPYLAQDDGILLLTPSTGSALRVPIEEQLVFNRDWIRQVDFPGLPAGMIAHVRAAVE